MNSYKAHKSTNWREGRAMSIQKLMATHPDLQNQHIEQITRLRRNVNSLAKKNNELTQQVHDLWKRLQQGPPPKEPTETRPRAEVERPITDQFVLERDGKEKEIPIPADEDEEREEECDESESGSDYEMEEAGEKEDKEKETELLLPPLPLPSPSPLPQTPRTSPIRQAPMPTGPRAYQRLQTTKPPPERCETLVPSHPNPAPAVKWIDITAIPSNSIQLGYMKQGMTAQNEENKG